MGTNGSHTSAGSGGPSRCNMSRISGAAAAISPPSLDAIAAKVRRQVRHRLLAFASCEKAVSSARRSAWTGGGAPWGHATAVMPSRGSACGVQRQMHTHNVTRRPCSWARPRSRGRSSAGASAPPSGHSRCWRSGEWPIGSRHTCSRSAPSVQASPSGAPRRSRSCLMSAKHGSLSACEALGSLIQRAQHPVRSCRSGRVEGASSHILQSHALVGVAGTRRKSGCLDRLSSNRCSFAPSSSAVSPCDSLQQAKVWRNAAGGLSSAFG
mmetsp:Transcript_53006/g.127606  ORF Transcript_53006/g.127606 Transcript_53006/m.127606 type:complete len:267 (-) Transcript_53006:140-940(-)